MSSRAKDLALLELHNNASNADIQKAFKAKALELHPDKMRTPDTDAFATLKSARDRLIDDRYEQNSIELRLMDAANDIANKINALPSPVRPLETPSSRF